MATLIAARSHYLGGVDSTTLLAPAFEPLDAGGAADGLLLVAVTWTHTAAPPGLRWRGAWGSLPLARLEAPAIERPDEVIRAGIWALAAPPPGPGRLEVESEGRFVGQVMAQYAAVLGVSGHPGTIAGLYHGGPEVSVSLPAAAAGAAMLAFCSTQWTATGSLEVFGDWAVRGRASGPLGRCLQALGGGDLELAADAWTHKVVMVLELPGPPAAPGDHSASGAPALPGLALAATAESRATVTPAGQRQAWYWASWFDAPDWPGPGEPPPEAFRLAHIAPHVGTVLLAFAAPYGPAGYADLSSDLRSTLYLDWPYSAGLLRDVVALLRANNPGVEVLLSVQQYTGVNEWDPEPYSPTGWGGMDSAQIAGLKRAVDDLGLDGIDIDYEVQSQSLDPAHHCYYDPESGLRVCWHDAELLQVIQDLRAAFPRPDYLLTCAAIHVGAYGEGDWRASLPLGWNSGYYLAVARNPTVRAMLDRMHLMTYDVGPGGVYDPREALAAYEHHFPEAELWLGIISADDTYALPWSQPKRNLWEIGDFANHVILRGQGGIFGYELVWGLLDDEFSFHATPNRPNSLMQSALIAQRFDLPSPATPLVPPEMLP